MKYFIVSDVHGSLHYVSKAFERFKESNADYFICLGDFYYHGPRNPLTQDYNPMKVSKLFNSLGNKLIAIRGNCDAEVDQMISTFIFKDNYTFNLSDNLKVYCHHGHKDIENIHQFNLILSGHTHVGVLKNDDGVLFANPGSISLPKAHNSQGFILLDEKSIQHFDLLDGHLIQKIIF